MSEETYHECLKCLYEYYLCPVAQRKLTYDGLMLSLTGNVVIIQGCTQNIRAALDLACQAVSAKKDKDDFYLADVDVGAVFLPQLPHLRMYSEYINQYDQVDKRLAELRTENGRFHDFLLTQEQRLSRGDRDLAFQALLITPIQRMTRYRLFFQMLVNHLEGHPFHASAVTCKQGIDKVCTYLNETKRLSDAVSRVVEVEVRFNTSLAEPGRYYIADAQMGKVTLAGNDVTPCVVFLFNNILMCFKQRKGMTPKRNISIELKDVIKVVDEERFCAVHSTPAFSVFTTQYCLTLVVASFTERTKWKELILKEVAKLNIKK